MDERAAFERNIDENPLDATNHLVYADWLDEHGEGDEAAFRRAMGEWIKKGIRVEEPTHPVESVADQQAAKRPYKISSTVGEVPKGVTLWHIPYFYDETYPSVYEPKGVVSSRPTRRDPTPSDAHYHPSTQDFSWTSYRDMERGLRRAFAADHPERLSRRSRFSRTKNRYYP